MLFMLINIFPSYLFCLFAFYLCTKLGLLPFSDRVVSVRVSEGDFSYIFLFVLCFLEIKIITCSLRVFNYNFSVCRFFG